MKKILLLIALTLVLLATASWLLLPSVVEKTASLNVACPSTAVSRYITAIERWNDWLPGNRVSDSVWKIGDKEFRVTTLLLNGFQALSTDQKFLIDLQFVPSDNKETVFTLHTQYALPFNPVYRLRYWINGGAIKKLNDLILSGMCKDFFSDPVNVYGMLITRGKVKDFSWISAKASFNHYPSTDEIYGPIGELENYILMQNARATGETIMHVQQVSPTLYELLVAIPTDRDLPSTQRFQLKNMILGSLLSAEVKGGLSRIAKAEQELENYVKDQQMVSPAIPFQTLVTDRRKVTDSTQWVSMVNYPIFN